MGRALAELAGRAEAAGVPRARILVDAGLDLGKTPEESLVLLRGSPALAALGYPVLLSASHKPFLGALLGLDRQPRAHASAAAHALGIIGGCRVAATHLEAAREGLGALGATRSSSGSSVSWLAVGWRPGGARRDRLSSSPQELALPAWLRRAGPTARWRAS
ncbi:MAG: dihydropteroate synthase [Actinomycetota bacterium]|nr:dihydropteroate synthase [Actinomycetota bacterium]